MTEPVYAISESDIISESADPEESRLVSEVLALFDWSDSWATEEYAIGVDSTLAFAFADVLEGERPTLRCPR